MSTVLKSLNSVKTGQSLLNSDHECEQLSSGNTEDILDKNCNANKQLYSGHIKKFIEEIVYENEGINSGYEEKYRSKDECGKELLKYRNSEQHISRNDSEKKSENSVKIVNSDINGKLLTSEHTVEKLDSVECERIKKRFPLADRFIRLNPGGWFFEESAITTLRNVQNFQFEESDVIVMTFPKCGTTWLQEVVWTFLHNPNLDNPTALDSIEIRSPQIEADLLFSQPRSPKISEDNQIVHRLRAAAGELQSYDDLIIKYAQIVPRPRVIKTHLPFSLLPNKILERSKIVYVARDPKDSIVSRFNFMQLIGFHRFTGSLDDYVDSCINEEIMFCPNWLHLYEAWEKRGHRNFLFIHYEDMINQPKIEYEKINKFLGTNLSQEKIDKIIDYTSFSSMKHRNETGQTRQPMSYGGKFMNEEHGRKTGGFFRKGKIGDWKNNFNEEQVKKINNWIKKRTQGFPSDFPYIESQ